MMTSITLIASLLAGLVLMQGHPDFKEPFRVTLEDGTFIDVDTGHSAPFMYDMDGDDLEDLLVGQFGGGRCRIYRNVGEPGNPRFEGFTWFEAGGVTASVPGG